uniref:Uncharacterized protein n=1 Tax=Ditylenchus dipsaci TaxID=166011 RepID=A0A915E5H5_9BILA
MECKGRGQLTPQSLIMASSNISSASTRLWRVIVNFKELQHADEENASDVKNGRQSPRKRSKIADAQQKFAAVLEYQIEDENFEVHLTAFLLHIEYLMGYNNRQLNCGRKMEEEPAAEQGWTRRRKKEGLWRTSKTLTLLNRRYN